MAGRSLKVREEKGLRLPPQSMEAEEAVLGAILVNSSSLPRIIGIVKPESFYKPANRIIYETMSRLFSQNQPIDIVTVSEALKVKGQLEEVGGRAYVNDLALNVVTTANIEYYAKIIQDNEIKRALINAGAEIANLGYEAESYEKALDCAQQKIFNIASNKKTSDFASVEDLVVMSYDKIAMQYNNKGQLSGVKTEFYALDDLTLGLQKSDLIILAARPSMGKTAFALNIAQNAALRDDRTVAIFSLEMDKMQLVTRMLCSEAEVDTQKIRSGNMQSKDWEKLTEAMTKFDNSKIYIDDSGALSANEIRARCRRLAMEKKGLDLVIVDYLQLMDSGINTSSVDSRNQQITMMSRGLKTLAKELGVPVIALSQLSRACESRPDKRPMLSDLRDSGAIEQDADIVMFIYRDEYYHPDDVDNKGKAELLIAKHRNGPTGKVDLYFQNNITKFKNPTKTEIY